MRTFSRTFPDAYKILRIAHLQRLKLLANGDESQVELAAEMIGQASVVVVNAEVGRADLAHAQFLLLVTTGRHGIPELDLKVHMNPAELNTRVRCHITRGKRKRGICQLYSQTSS